jgi:hypothetical protein
LVKRYTVGVKRKKKDQESPRKNGAEKKQPGSNKTKKKVMWEDQKENLHTSSSPAQH